MWQRLSEDAAGHSAVHTAHMWEVHSSMTTHWPLWGTEKLFSHITTSKRWQLFSCHHSAPLKQCGRLTTGQNTVKLTHSLIVCVLCYSDLRQALLTHTTAPLTHRRLIGAAANRSVAEVKMQTLVTERRITQMENQEWIYRRIGDTFCASN